MQWIDHFRNLNYLCAIEGQVVPRLLKTRVSPTVYAQDGNAQFCQLIAWCQLLPIPEHP